MADTENPRPARHARRWIPALAVIAMGVLFLIVNLGYRLPFLDYANWWAWFILFGAAWPLGEAIDRYRVVGKLDASVWHALLPGLSIVLVALFFILHLSWAIWWPLFVILGGLYMLGEHHRHRGRDRD